MFGRVIAAGLFCLLCIRTLVVSASIFSTNASVSTESAFVALAIVPFLIVFIFVLGWIYKGRNSDWYIPVLIGSGLANLWLFFVFGIL